MLVKYAKLIPVSLSFIFLLSCGGNSNPDPNEPQPKFYSSDNMGKWGNQAPTHIPQITQGEVGDDHEITIKVPLEANPGHYIEAILLTDENHKELSKKSLGKSMPAIATFKLPVGRYKKFYAVIKCNLHDMWEVEVKPN